MPIASTDENGVPLSTPFSQIFKPQLRAAHSEANLADATTRLVAAASEWREREGVPTAWERLVSEE
jgi:hypothetical protein